MRKMSLGFEIDLMRVRYYCSVATPLTDTSKVVPGTRIINRDSISLNQVCTFISGNDDGTSIVYVINGDLHETKYEHPFNDWYFYEENVAKRCCEIFKPKLFQVHIPTLGFSTVIAELNESRVKRVLAHEYHLMPVSILSARISEISEVNGFKVEVKH